MMELQKKGDEVEHFWLHLLIAQRVQKTIPTNIPMGKAAEAKMTSLALAKPDFLPVKLAMKAIRKKPHWKEKGVSKVVVETF